MKPSLGKSWELILEQGYAFLRRREDEMKVAAVSAIEAVCLGLMNGERSIEEIAGKMTDILGEDGKKVVGALNLRLGPLLVEQGKHPLDIPLEWLARIRSPDRSAGLRPLPGPRVLHWWATNVCSRRCAYCFAHPEFGGQAYDSKLSSIRLKHIFQEAASLGAKNLLIGGGEPFLRKDLPEIIGDAIKAGITPLLTTKYRIHQKLANRLAQAGLRHICLSVDSFQRDQAKSLIGFAGYGDQVRRSASYLRSAGIAFSMECVITAINEHNIEEVADEANRLGAIALQFVPFEPVQYPIGPYQNEDLLVKNPDDLEDKIEEIQKAYPELQVERFGNRRAVEWEEVYCDIGQTKLFFDPEGRVHRCYKLLDDDNLFGADLRKVSVAEAWHDPDFSTLIAPPQAHYRNTACGSCDLFGDCNRKGRCIFRAWVERGGYYAPDRICP